MCLFCLPPTLAPCVFLFISVDVYGKQTMYNGFPLEESGLIMEMAPHYSLSLCFYECVCVWESFLCVGGRWGGASPVACIAECLLEKAAELSHRRLLLAYQNTATCDLHLSVRARALMCTRTYLDTPPDVNGDRTETRRPLRARITGKTNARRQEE